MINGNRPRILKVCRVYAWNAADRDDLYQEILFQIWRGLPGLKQDIHDKFHLGSVTKSMTATVAAMLVEQGKISWTTTIGEAFQN